MLFDKPNEVVNTNSVTDVIIGLSFFFVLFSIIPSNIFFSLCIILFIVYLLFKHQFSVRTRPNYKITVIGDGYTSSEDEAGDISDEDKQEDSENINTSESSDNEGVEEE